MSIESDARHKGELEYSFDQSESAVMTQPGPWGNAYSGYCAGLAMKWINLRLAGKDYPFDAKTRTLGDLPHWHATRDQNVYEDADYATALDNYGLEADFTTHHRVGGPDAGWLRQIAEHAAGCYLISLRRDGGGHAVAMQSDPIKKTYRFFDANYGHFVLKGADRFQVFLTDYLLRSNYKTRYSKETFVYPVEAKPGAGGAKTVAELRKAFSK